MPRPNNRSNRRFTPLILGSAALALALAGCQKSAPDEAPEGTMTAPEGGTTGGATGGAIQGSTGGVVVPPADDKAAPKTNLVPPEPGQPGGLPRDKAPVSEGKIDPKSPQGAAQLVQIYGSLLEQGKYAEAYKMWGLGGDVSGMSEKQFTDRFAGYSEVRTMVGAPTEPEGAAGSIYVTVPMQIYGRLKTGGTFNLVGPIILKRVNNVPGATQAQLEWHLSKSGLKPEGTVKEVPAE